MEADVQILHQDCVTGFLCVLEWVVIAAVVSATEITVGVTEPVDGMAEAARL